MWSTGELVGFFRWIRRWSVQWRGRREMLRARVPLTAGVSSLRLKRTNSTSRPSKINPSEPLSSGADRLLFLQRTLGNRAVERLFEGGSATDGTQGTEPLRQMARIQRAVSSRSFRCPNFAGDAKLEACLNDRDRLRPGDKGPSVQKVQRALLNDDVFIGPEGADGKFGPKRAPWSASRSPLLPPLHSSFGGRKGIFPALLKERSSVCLPRAISIGTNQPTDFLNTVNFATT